jgi:hypothetical protein
MMRSTAAGSTVALSPNLLANATDPDNDSVSVKSCSNPSIDTGWAISAGTPGTGDVCLYTVSQTGSTNTATLKVKADGGGMLADPNHIFNGLAAGVVVEFKVDYLVTDGSLQDSSTASFQIEGADEPAADVELGVHFEFTDSGPAVVLSARNLGPTTSVTIDASCTISRYNAAPESLTVNGYSLAKGDSFTTIASKAIPGLPTEANCEVTSSSLPDPDSTPNNHATTEDDYAADI